MSDISEQASSVWPPAQASSSICPQWGREGGWTCSRSASASNTGDCCSGACLGWRGGRGHKMRKMACFLPWKRVCFLPFSFWQAHCVQQVGHQRGRVHLWAPFPSGIMVQRSVAWRTNSREGVTLGAPCVWAQGHRLVRRASLGPRRAGPRADGSVQRRWLGWQDCVCARANHLGWEEGIQDTPPPCS
jgi:hypothetical protein